MAPDQQLNPAVGLLMALNCCMYVTILGIGGWTMNRAIDHGFIIGPGSDLPARMPPIYFPVGNAATGLFVLFALIAAVAGLSSAHVATGKVAWALTLLAMGLYEIKDGNVFFTMDLVQRTCNCQAWQNSGILCKHAASAIRSHRGNMEGYVDAWYSKDKYLQTYEGVIHPIPDPSIWLEDQEQILDPPELTRKAGRQRSKNQKEKGEEPNRPKGYVVIHCKKCKQIVHNARTCMGGVVRQKGPKQRPMPEGPGDQKEGQENTLRFLSVVQKLPPNLLVPS